MPIFGAGWIARKTGEAQQGWYGSVARRSRVSSPSGREFRREVRREFRKVFKIEHRRRDGCDQFWPTSRAALAPFRRPRIAQRRTGVVLSRHPGRQIRTRERKSPPNEAAYRGLDTRYFKFGRNDSSWRFLVLQQSEIDLRKPSHRPVDILPQCPAEGLKRPQMPPH
jgi:hypothetical protein